MMKMTLPVALLAILVVSATEVQACGRRCDCRRGFSRQVVVQPYSYAPSSYSSLATPIAAAPALPPSAAYPSTVPAPSAAYPTAVQGAPATPEGNVQPMYTYEVSPQNGGAYYYTYDESGKLIIKQWMDWLFRGGRQAGLPAPALPIVGRLNN